MRLLKILKILRLILAGLYLGFNLTTVNADFTSYSSSNESFNNGMKNKNISKFIEAKNDFEIALKQFQINQEENLINIAETYAELGEIEYYLDKYNESEKAYDASLKAYKKLSDKLGEARILKGKANLERVKKNYAISQKYFDDALEIYKSNNDDLNIAYIYLGLGEIDGEKGRSDAALRNFEIAKKIFINKNNKLGQARSYLDVGKILKIKGDKENSFKNLHQALGLYQEEKNILGIAQSFTMLGSLNYKYGLFEDAKIYYEKSLVLYEQMQDKSTAAHLYIDLGNLELNLNNLDQARKRFDDALSKFDIKEDPNLIWSLGNLEKLAGQNDRAKLQYKKALDLFEKIPNHIGQAFVLRQLAELNKSDGKYNEARSNYRESAIKYGLASMSLEQKSMINLSNQFWFQEWIIWIFLLLALIFLLSFLKFKKMNLFKKNENAFQNKEINLGRKWVNYSSDKEVTVIFIHGIFSNPDAFKNTEVNLSWADLLSKDERFNKPNIYLGQFYTAPESGIFDITQAAQDMKVQLTTLSFNGQAAPLDSKNIVFIAHSTGGLVIRDLLTRRSELFKDKKIGLVLVASPSRGSEWANRLKVIIDATSNKMANQLQKGNELVADLDRRFADFVSLTNEQRGFALKGIDLYENRFVLNQKLFGLFISTKTVVVSERDSASYFGAGRIVPDTDHFSIAKPDNLDHPSHRYLVEFWLNNFMK